MPGQVVLAPDGVLRTCLDATSMLSLMEGAWRRLHFIDFVGSQRLVEKAWDVVEIGHWDVVDRSHGSVLP